jgi:hypothetical protein
VCQDDDRASIVDDVLGGPPVPRTASGIGYGAVLFPLFVVGTVSAKTVSLAKKRHITLRLEQVDEAFLGAK